MLPNSVERKVDEVARDHESGATHLAIRALRAFDLLASSGALDTASVRELRERLEAAQPAMASVRNTARMAAARLSGDKAQWPGFRDGLLRELEEGRRRVAAHFLKVVPPKAAVVTISRSVNVFECCVTAARQGLVAHVYVLESEPGLEGLRLAEDLREAGVNADAIADGSAASSLRDPSSLALVGADTVFADGAVVNKVGTRTLAEACHTSGRSFYVACETIKFDPTPSTKGWGTGSRRGELFDLTPPSLVAAFVTDRGVWRPDQLPSMLPRLR